jgi:hypothetical protein
MALCTNCRDFDIQAFNAGNRNIQSYEFTLLAIAAAEGCPFCKFIYVNKPSYAGRDMKDLWVHFRMVGAGEVRGGQDELLLGVGEGVQAKAKGKGKGKKDEGKGFTRCQVWIGLKVMVRGVNHKEFRLLSDPGM